MALTASEIQSLRFHLGYGNVSQDGRPYTPDGFWEVFEQIISPNLGTGTETTGSTAIVAGSVTTITVASITDIAANARLVVDVGENAEIVAVRSISGSTLTAYFANAHTASYPVALLSGTARLRLLIHAADRAWQAAMSGKILSTAGIKQVDKGDVEWFGPGAVRIETAHAYRDIVASISSLVRVQVRDRRPGRSSLEVF